MTLKPSEHLVATQRRNLRLVSMTLDVSVAATSLMLGVYQWRKAASHWHPSGATIGTGPIYGYSQEWSLCLQIAALVYLLVSRLACATKSKNQPKTQLKLSSAIAIATIVAIVLPLAEWLLVLSSSYSRHPATIVGDSIEWIYVENVVLGFVAWLVVGSTILVTAREKFRWLSDSSTSEHHT